MLSLLTHLPDLGAGPNMGIAYLTDAYKSVCLGLAAYHAAAPNRQRVRAETVYKINKIK
jgi:hypothetical protein